MPTSKEYEESNPFQRQANYKFYNRFFFYQNDMHESTTIYAIELSHQYLDHVYVLKK